MNVRLEYIAWPSMDVHEDGTHPYTEGGNKIYYCYYVPKGKVRAQNYKPKVYVVLGKT